MTDDRRRYELAETPCFQCFPGRYPHSSDCRRVFLSEGIQKFLFPADLGMDIADKEYVQRCFQEVALWKTGCRHRAAPA
jgi:hypothetical protein